MARQKIRIPKQRPFGLLVFMLFLPYGSGKPYKSQRRMAKFDIRHRHCFRGAGKYLPEIARRNIFSSGSFLGFLLGIQIFL